MADYGKKGLQEGQGQTGAGKEAGAGRPQHPGSQRPEAGKEAGAQRGQSEKQAGQEERRPKGL